jgi:hypothetical protein
MNPINPLAALKEKLMIKPNVEERERVAVVIKGVNKPIKAPIKAPKKQKIVEREEGEVSDDNEEEEGEVKEKKPKQNLEETEKQAKIFGPTIVDETHKGFDRNALLQKLAENKKLKVTIQPVFKISEDKKIRY